MSEREGARARTPQSIEWRAWLHAAHTKLGHTFIKLKASRSSSTLRHTFVCIACKAVWPEQMSASALTIALQSGLRVNYCQLLLIKLNHFIGLPHLHSLAQSLCTLCAHQRGLHHATHLLDYLRTQYIGPDYCMFICNGLKLKLI